MLTEQNPAQVRPVLAACGTQGPFQQVYCVGHDLTDARSDKLATERVSVTVLVAY